MDGVAGEAAGAAAALEPLILSALSQQLRVDVDEVRDEVAFLAGEGEPIFVALPAHGVDRVAVAALQQAFPGVTFFLLTGEQAPDAATLQTLEQAGIELLRPVLEAGAETAFCDLYKRKKRLLLRGL